MSHKFRWVTFNIKATKNEVQQSKFKHLLLYETNPISFNGFTGLKTLLTTLKIWNHN